MSDPLPTSRPDTPQRSILLRLLDRQPLAPDDARKLAEGLFDTDADPVWIAAALVALRMKGETATEMAAAAEALRKRMTRFDTRGTDVLDTCGTGGDGTQTFNISTAAAFVIAAAGGPVVKHGNRGVSSRSGSADVLHALGLPIRSGTGWARRCFDETGLAFCFAPNFHPALANLAELRQRLGFRTLLNLIGPLSNPADACYQLLGVGDANRLDDYAKALARLGTRRAAVVVGADGVDEVSPTGPTCVRWLADGRITEVEWHPSDFGFEPCALAELKVADAAESAATIRAVLDGRPGPCRQAVIMNAAAGLVVCGKADDLRAGVAAAAEGIDRGTAKRLLQRLIAIG